MKNIFCILFPALAGLALVSCSQNEPLGPATPVKGELTTIHASIPKDATRVEFTAAGDGLHLSWEDDDCLRVISESGNGLFIIKEDYDDQDAEFTGPTVSGTSFDILYPGSCESIEELEAALADPLIQNGNGNTSHLCYYACLKGVDSYQQIVFSKDWAEDHGGEFLRPGIAKLVLTMPEGVTKLSKVSLTLGSDTYGLSLKNVNVSTSDQVLTAYIMLPWEDISLAASSKVAISVIDNNDEEYGISITLPEAKTLKAGVVSNFKIASGIEKVLFAGGSGTEADPYLIANKKHLENMMLMYKDGTSDWMKYFKMIDDVDAAGIEWTPLNYLDPYTQGLYFDGDGHTISNLTVGDACKYASFAGVLYGEIVDVTFDGAVIDGGAQKSGVVCGYLGTGELVGNCSGVTVSNSKVSSTEYCGGFAAQGSAAGTVSDCHVLKTVIHQDNETADAQKSTGGFMGHCAAVITFTDCTAEVEIVAKTPKKSGVGGFLGKAHGKAPVIKNCKVLSGSSVTAAGNWIGGFVGFAQGGGSYVECSSAADVSVSSTGQFAGGFLGYSQNSASFTKCSASGTVSAPLNVGGFLGCTDGCSFTNCSYEGSSVQATNASGNVFAGGFCGLIGNTGVVFDGCSVYSPDGVSVSSTGNRVGGFIGQNSKNGTTGQSTATKCCVKNATISGASNTGGFVGVQYSDISTSRVENVTVTAAGANSAAFSAFLSGCNISDCYATATVDAGSNDSAGGLVGIYQANSGMKNSFFKGDVTGSGNNYGGIIGNLNASDSVTGCISWNASLPMVGNASDISGNYAGTTGSISEYAILFGWDEAVWNLTGSVPTLK